MRDSWKLLLAVAACFFGMIGMLSGRPVERAPGMLVQQEPIQALIEGSASFPLREYQVTPRARYDIEARVLSVERYKFDGGSPLSPIDFAVGWGVMSDSAVLDHFRVSQGGRFFTIYPDEQAISIEDALRGTANMHLIPSNSSVRKQLEDVKPGHVVHLQGYLVDITGPNNYTWNTSLTRLDTGAGACELFYVESVAKR